VKWEPTPLEVNADLRAPMCVRCEDMDIYDRSPESCPECAANRLALVGPMIAARALREAAATANALVGNGYRTTAIIESLLARAAELEATP